MSSTAQSPRSWPRGRNPGSLTNDDDVESNIEKGVKFMLTAWTSWAASGAQEFRRKVESASS